MSRVLRPIPLGKRRGLLNAAFRTPAYPGDAVVTLQTPGDPTSPAAFAGGAFFLSERASIAPRAARA